MKNFFLPLINAVLFAAYSFKCFCKELGPNTRHFFGVIREKTEYRMSIIRLVIGAVKKRWIVLWCAFLLLFVGFAVMIFNATTNYYLVSYNGTGLGYVRNLNMANTAVNSLKTQFADNENVLEDLSNFEISQIQSSNWFLHCFNKDELLQAMAIASDTIEYGYMVYIDGEYVLSINNMTVFNNAYNDYKVDRITLSPDVRAEYEECEVEVLNSVKTENACMLAGDICVSEPYMKLYDIFEDKLKYRIECVQTVTENVPYVTYYQYNENLAPGSKKVVQAGKYGTKDVRSRLIIENGELISTEILSEKVITNAVMRRVQIGNGVTSGAAGGISLLLPVEGYLTSGYGDRPDPFTGEEAYHTGLDIAASSGTEIIAAASGKVIQASDKNNGYGKCVIIEHSAGFKTLYAHCSSLDVQVGDYVAAGQVIARVGSTGRSTGPHLHFSVIINGEYVDPNLYF